MRAMSGWFVVVLLAGAACGDDAGEREQPEDAGRDGASGAPADAGGEPDADADAGPTADCATSEIPAFEDVEIFAKCLGCHSTEREGAARNSAPVTADFDDYDSAAAVAELAAQYVFHGSMPPPVTGITVTEPEKEQLYLWALCGTPE